MGMVRKVRCGQKIAFARSGHIWLLKFIFVCHIWLLVQCLSPMHASNGSQAGLWTTKNVKQMVWLKYLRYQTNLAFWHHTHGLG